MARPANPRFVTAKEAAFFNLDGEDIVISPNEIYRADDRMVQAKPHLFKPVQASRQRPDVEQATARRVKCGARSHVHPGPLGSCRVHGWAGWLGVGSANPPVYVHAA